MTDIVERLRNPLMRMERTVDGSYAPTIAPSRAVVDPEDAERVRLAAAAEIERLREALRSITDGGTTGFSQSPALNMPADDWLRYRLNDLETIARTALGEAKDTTPSP